MSVFKEDVETKRVIFNINIDLAERLEKAKKDSRKLGKKLDIDGALNKALEKFLKKAEKKISEMQPGKKKSLKDKPGKAVNSDSPAITSEDLAEMSDPTGIHK